MRIGAANEQSALAAGRTGDGIFVTVTHFQLLTSVFLTLGRGRRLRHHATPKVYLIVGCCERRIKRRLKGATIALSRDRKGAVVSVSLPYGRGSAAAVTSSHTMARPCHCPTSTDSSGRV